MTLKRNKKAINPNVRPMSVASMRHQILEENEKVLKLLDELEATDRKRRWERWKERNL